MSFHALTNGRLVHASSFSGDSASCLVCGDDVFIRARNSVCVRTHFYHMNGAEHSGESERHSLAKYTAAEWLGSFGIDARVEVPIGARRADVALFQDGHVVAVFEVQLSLQTRREKMQRTNDYLACGVRDVAWAGRYHEDVRLYAVGLALKYGKHGEVPAPMVEWWERFNQKSGFEVWFFDSFGKNSSPMCGSCGFRHEWIHP